MEGIAMTPALLDHVVSGIAFQSVLLSQWKAWRKGGVEVHTPEFIHWQRSFSNLVLTQNLFQGS